MFKLGVLRLSTRSRIGLWAAAVMAALCCAATAWAMRVSPMVAELTTVGTGSAARIEVGNVGSVALPFETMITKLDFDENGQIVETPADDQFLVFPPQGVVAVGGRQVVRVQWVGDPRLPQSEAYYLWVKQLPVATDLDAKPAEGGALALTVLYTMKALLVVAPPGAAPDVKVDSVTPKRIAAAEPRAEGSAPDQPGVEVVVSNAGKRYALMSGATWIVEGVDLGGQPVRKELKGGEVSALVGVGYLAPAGGRRTFQIPTGVDLDPSKPVTVRFAQ